MRWFSENDALPNVNIGPIWHDRYCSIMTWQAFTANGANYTGYASLLVGSLLFDTQPTPRKGYVSSGVNNLTRTVYAAVRAWAMHNGRMVAPGVWKAGEVVVCDNADGLTFTVYDLRGKFQRAWSNGSSIDAGRAFGSTQNATRIPIVTTVNAGGGIYRLLTPPSSLIPDTNNSVMPADTDSIESVAPLPYPSIVLAGCSKIPWHLR